MQIEGEKSKSENPKRIHKALICGIVDILQNIAQFIKVTTRSHLILARLAICPLLVGNKNDNFTGHLSSSALLLGIYSYFIYNRLSESGCEHTQKASQSAEQSEKQLAQMVQPMPMWCALLQYSSFTRSSN